jgi:hypothetical protein
MARPTKSHDCSMLGALSYMASHQIAEHEWEMISGGQLKDDIHPAPALRTGCIFYALNPVWPAGQLIA